MDTLKTVFVVGLLGVVLYFAYTFLSKDAPTPPPDVADLTENLDDLAAPDVDLGPSLAPDSQYGSVIEADVLETGEADDAREHLGNEFSATGAGTDSSDDPYSEVNPAYGSQSSNLQDPDPYGSGNASVGGLASEYAEPRAPYGDQVETDSAGNPKQPLAANVPSNDYPSTDYQGSDYPSSDYPSTDNRGNDYVGNDYVGNDDVGNDDVGNDDTASDAGNPVAGEGVADWDGEKLLVDKLLTGGNYLAALQHLTDLYRYQSLSEVHRAEALRILDPLAGKVVYSREHLIEQAHIVRDGESLMTIAQQYRVPWQLLRNINGVENPLSLEVGSSLKVVPGPFEAEVDTRVGELTLYVRGAYAGRFAVQVGNNPVPSTGEYQVQRKEEGKTFAGGSNGALPKDHPDNPYGRVWLELGNSMGIHGSHQPQPHQMGCISLSPTDAADIYAILSQGSVVLVR